MQNEWRKGGGREERKEAGRKRWAEGKVAGIELGMALNTFTLAGRK